MEDINQVTKWDDPPRTQQAGLHGSMFLSFCEVERGGVEPSSLSSSTAAQR